jgi:multidrug efflux pump subunit AcrA (membrane-fusion protein)
MKPLGHLTLAIWLLAAVACTSKKNDEASAADAAPATPVQVAAARQGTLHSYISAEAVLYPLRQATITPKITAPVAKFFVQRGDHVKQDQLLAILENRDLTAAAQESKQLYEQSQATYLNTASATMPDDLTRAKTDVETAREALDASQKVYANRQSLFQQGAIAQKLVDDAKVALVQAQSQFQTAQQHLQSLQTVGRTEQLKSAEAQTAAAKAHYESAAAQLSYAEVRSPIVGVVSDRPVNLGEMANAGSPLLSIVDVSRVTARATIPVAEAALVRLGKPATISSGTLSLSGKVSVVSPAVDPSTTTVQVWVEAANPGERLKLGSTVQVSIDAGEIANAISVPTSALLSSDEGGDKVMIVGSDSVAHEQPVKTGVSSGEETQILSGVKAGDQVITQGGLGLDDKSKVKIIAAGADDQAPESKQ